MFFSENNSRVQTLLRRHRELISYVFWGVMTTIINYAAYFLLTKGLQVYYLTSNIIAWTISVLFAYLVNKLFVFQSKGWAWRVALRELWQMVASRLFSGALELGLLWLFVDALRLPDGPVKIAANVVVIVVNYVLSKWIIFKKRA